MKLKKGDLAPLFEGLDQNGKPLTLSSMLGKKIVLYFYPKDNTPGCTAQACNLRDHTMELKNKNCVIIGVSADSEKSHKKFEIQFNLPFTLIVDTDKKLIKKYGVYGKKILFGLAYQGIRRTTFLINEKGLIDHIIEKPNTKNHTEQIVKLWGL